MGLKTYFTTGEKETKAWTIKDGMTAPQAAGVIHTDFEKGFIRAQTISYQNLIDSGSIANAKTKGLLRSEGKEYICLLYTSPSPRDMRRSRMPSSA